MKAYDLVLIVGPKHNITTLKAACAQSGTQHIIIGDGINPITKDQITALNGKLSPAARIDIWAHGNAANGVHSLDLMDPKGASKSTSMLLDLIGTALCPWSPPNHVDHYRQVHLWSCYAGAAKNGIGNLPENTLLITHASSQHPSYVHMNDEGIKDGIAAYKHSNPLIDFARVITSSPETATLSMKLGGTSIDYTARASTKPLSLDLARDLKERVLADYITALEPLKPLLGHEKIIGGIKQLAANLDPQALTKYSTNAVIIKQNLINADYIRDFLAMSAPRDDFLHYAIRHGTPAIAAIIHADPRTKLNVSLDGTTPLHYTVTYNQQPIFTALVADARTNFDLKDNEGNTALHLAAKDPQRAHFIPELADRTTAELINFDHQTALHLAARFGGPANITAVLKHVWREPTVTDHDGSHPLHIAAAYAGPDSIAAFLSDVWTDVNARDKKKRTPLHIAAIHDKPENINALLGDSKCAINAQDNNGNTALHLAIEKRQPGSVAALLKRGASTVITNINDKTPIQLAEELKLAEEIIGSSEGKKERSTITAMLTPTQINKNDDARTHTTLEKETDKTIFSVHFKTPQKRDHFLCANATLLAAIKNGAEQREMFTASAKDLYIHDHGTSTHFVEFMWSKTIHPHLASTLDRFVEAAQKIVPHPPVPERTKQLPKRRVATIAPPATELPPRPLPSFAERMQQASQRQQAIAAR